VRRRTVSGASHKESLEPAFALRTHHDCVDVSFVRELHDRLGRPALQDRGRRGHAGVGNTFGSARKYRLRRVIQTSHERHQQTETAVGRGALGNRRRVIDGVAEEQVAAVPPGESDCEGDRAIPGLGAVGRHEHMSQDAGHWCSLLRLVT